MNNHSIHCLVSAITFSSFCVIAGEIILKMPRKKQGKRFDALHKARWTARTGSSSAVTSVFSTNTEAITENVEVICPANLMYTISLCIITEGCDKSS